ELLGDFGDRLVRNGDDDDVAGARDLGGVGEDGDVENAVGPLASGAAPRPRGRDGVPGALEGEPDGAAHATATHHGYDGPPRHSHLKRRDETKDGGPPFQFPPGYRTWTESSLAQVGALRPRTGAPHQKARHDRHDEAERGEREQ